MRISAVVLLILLPIILSEQCHFDVKVKQILLNEGFHRNITYGIVFRGEYEDDWLYRSCIVGLEQALPSGVYVNPDELSDLRRMKRINAFPRSKVNVELPTEQASPSTVYVIGKVTDSHVNLWLPVHARYHQAASGGGTARNEIASPKMFLRCPDERLHLCNMSITSNLPFLCNGSSREKCDWKEIPYNIMTDTLRWEAPVGNTDHTLLVCLGTSIVVIVGSLYILQAVHQYNIRDKRKKM